MFIDGHGVRRFYTIVVARTYFKMFQICQVRIHAQTTHAHICCALCATRTPITFIYIINITIERERERETIYICAGSAGALDRRQLQNFRCFLRGGNDPRTYFIYCYERQLYRMRCLFTHVNLREYIPRQKSFRIRFE